MTRKISSAGADPLRAEGAHGEGWSGAAESLPPDAVVRLRRLCASSPLYAEVLRQNPGWVRWLEDERNLHSDFRYGAIVQEWSAFAAAAGLDPADADARLQALRRWRRLMSMRIAHRSVNDLAPERTAVEELTRLAEFCVRECLRLSTSRWTERHGQPWDEALDRPARFCVVALGKLGGCELNFSSDIDLLFVYDGEGYCRREGRSGPFSNVEFFTKVAEGLSAALGAQTEEGFLFRVDARLRPEGTFGPLVRSLTSLENYYAVAGQTWERLALLKARPVAGDVTLGHELLESVQSFRYPRNPPPSLLREVAAMKHRTELEVVGAEALERDVKSGPGGIREIEFVVQAMQLLHAGRYPFLQTHSTETALEQLVRYGLMARDQADFLRSSYWFLRRVEHRLQLREERQTHTLPDDPAQLDPLASSLGFGGWAAFLEALRGVRLRIRAIYQEHFPAEEVEEFDAWWLFFTSGTLPPFVAERLERWFGAAPSPAEDLRRFACGAPTHVVTREQVLRFEHLARSFDELMPTLAQPLATLKRLGRFAERYGSRNHFFAACGDNPQLLRALALLFDRSTFIHELLCTHPEILEEVIRPEILSQHKDLAGLLRELAEGPEDPAARAQWFPLYVRAEQVRYATAELLGLRTRADTESALTRLADAAIIDLCRRSAPLDRLLVVALGSYGGEELSFGADLDVLFLGGERDAAELERPLREALRTLRGLDPLGAVLDVDPRLRPHGEAGPLIATPSSFLAYHRGGAQFWERQLLVRARVVAGPDSLRQAWSQLIAELIDQPPVGDSEYREAWRMRRRIETERDVVTPPERAFKTTAGGLVDHEFLVQLMQMRHGHRLGRRLPGTRAALRELTRSLLIPEDAGNRLLENHDFLKRLEEAVRLDTHTPVSVLPEDGDRVSRWLGFGSSDAFLEEHRRRLAETRRLVLNLLFPGDDQG